MELASPVPPTNPFHLAVWELSVLESMQWVPKYDSNTCDVIAYNNNGLSLDGLLRLTGRFLSPHMLAAVNVCQPVFHQDDLSSRCCCSAPFPSFPLAAVLKLGWSGCVDWSPGQFHHWQKSCSQFALPSRAHVVVAYGHYIPYCSSMPRLWQSPVTKLSCFYLTWRWREEQKRIW